MKRHCIPRAIWPHCRLTESGKIQNLTGLWHRVFAIFSFSQRRCCLTSNPWSVKSVISGLFVRRCVHSRELLFCRKRRCSLRVRSWFKVFFSHCSSEKHRINTIFPAGNLDHMHESRLNLKSMHCVAGYRAKPVSGACLSHYMVKGTHGTRMMSNRYQTADMVQSLRIRSKQPPRVLQRAPRAERTMWSAFSLSSKLRRSSWSSPSFALTRHSRSRIITSSDRLLNEHTHKPHASEPMPASSGALRTRNHEARLFECAVGEMTQKNGRTHIQVIGTKNVHDGSITRLVALRWRLTQQCRSCPHVASWDHRYHVTNATS